MSAANKSIIFLLLTFAISWGVTIGAHFAGLKETVGTVVILVAMMAGPAIAALICAFAFEKGQRVAALGLHFRPNWWWLFAWLIPLAIAAISVIATLLLSDRTYTDVGAATIAAIEARDPAQAEHMRQIPYLGMIILASAIFMGALINTPILTFTEELGWRGYLYYLWRPAGFWRVSLATGLIWGIWHAPAILFYGLNYPEHATLGIGLFTVYCLLLSPIVTLVRERAGSVWAAGIFHGTVNAVGGLTLMMVNNPQFPWNGIVGIGGFVALALGVVFVFLLQRRPPTANARTSLRPRAHPHA
jgi:uncharacterized protein